MSDSPAASTSVPDPEWPVELSLSAECARAGAELSALYGPVELLASEFDRPPALRLKQYDLRRWERAPALAALERAAKEVLQFDTARQLPALSHQAGRLAALVGKLEAAASLFRRTVEVLEAGPAKVVSLQNLLLVLLEAHRHSEGLEALGELAELSPTDAPLPVERYEVQEILGAGTFATVFRCLDRETGGPVVVKALAQQPAGQVFPPLFQEPAVLVAINHPSVARCLAHGYADPAREAGPYCVMEFFDGINLHEYIRRYGPLSWQQVLHVLIEALQTLAALHAQGIVHADIKPGNLLVRCDHDGWRIKLIDFGIAVRTDEPAAQLRPHERRPATPGFSAPEQIGQIAAPRLTPAADIYALARTACYCLLGRVESNLSKLRDFPSAMETVLRSSLLVPPEQRPTAGDLLAILLQPMNAVRGPADEHATVGTVMPAEAGPASGIGTHAAGPGTSNKGPGTDVALEPDSSSTGESRVAMPPPLPPPATPKKYSRSGDLAMWDDSTDLPPPPPWFLESISPSLPPGYTPPPAPRPAPSGGPGTARGAPVPGAAMPENAAGSGLNPGQVVARGASAVSNAIGALGHAIGSLFRKNHDGHAGGNHQPVSDPVDCTVFAPAWVDRGSSVMVQVAVHLKEAAGQVALMAKQFDATAERRGVKRLAAEVARGSRLLIQLSAAGLTVDDPQQSVVWRGEPELVQFGVSATVDATPRTVVATLQVSIDGVPFGQVKFTLSVRATSSGTQPAPQQHRLARYRKVFVSYSSADRDEVLKRVQMLRQMQVEVFQDVLSLEPGQRWQRELYRRIDDSDLFLLFWSSSARSSEWVGKEVQYALDRQRQNPHELPDIVPVILEGPPIPLPPPELAHLHFNDQILSHLKQAVL